MENILDSFDIFYDKAIDNKLSICIFPKIQNITNIEISELINKHKDKFNPKIHLYIVCDISGSMDTVISDVSLENINYNDRNIKLPEKISKTRKSIGFTASALLSHILQNEIIKTNLSANLHIIPFSRDINSYKYYENIEKIDDIDYLVFEHLVSIEEKNGATIIEKALRKINKLIYNEPKENSEDIKIVFILTDGDFNNVDKAKEKYNKLLTHKNISIGCVSMGRNTTQEIIKQFNVDKYYYFADFISNTDNNVLDIIPYIFYNLLNYVFTNNVKKISENTKTLSIRVINNTYKLKKRNKPKKNMYESCEIIEYNGSRVEIWNVESEYEDEYENEIEREFQNIKKYDYFDCDDKKWDKTHFTKEIYYPVSDNKMSYSNNCMTPIYALVSYDENTILTFITNERSVNVNIDNIKSNITMTQYLEILQKTIYIAKIYEENIFKNIIKLKNQISCDKSKFNYDEHYIKILGEIKKINESFHLHLSKLSEFMNICSQISENNEYEKYIKIFTIDKILSVVEFIKNKKKELFNPRNKSELYTISSIRQASTYKSLISLKAKNENTNNFTHSDNIACKICMLKPSNMCNIHCGHVVTCDSDICLSYMNDIDSCIVCRNQNSKISSFIKILLDENYYRCVMCSGGHSCNNAEYLLDCGHVGFCDECVMKETSKIFNCHRCKKKSKILCRIFI
jgi:hypothetical protein